MRRKVFLLAGILLIGIGCFYAYVDALGSMWAVNKPDKRPFYITTKPVVIKNIVLPEQTKIIYKQQYFWQKGQQQKPLDPEDIIEISFKQATTIDWAGVPITSIVRFFNEQMNGFSVYADFNTSYKKTPFSMLWQSCDDNLGVVVENLQDWSFNKKNIIDVASCSVLYQRYFKEDQQQQAYLNALYDALLEVKE